MINLIVAIGRNNLIGKDNDLPWDYPEDLKYFKEITLGKTVLMGDATFYSIVSRINKPLPGRKNIVASLDKNFSYSNVLLVTDLLSFLNEKHEEDIFIIGGLSIYKLSLPYVERLYITHIDADHEGNVFFPIIDYSLYNKISSRKNGVLEFAVYEKK